MVGWNRRDRVTLLDPPVNVGSEVSDKQIAYGITLFATLSS